MYANPPGREPWQDFSVIFNASFNKVEIRFPVVPPDHIRQHLSQSGGFEFRKFGYDSFWCAIATPAVLNFAAQFADTWQAKICDLSGNTPPPVPSSSGSSGSYQKKRRRNSPISAQSSNPPHLHLAPPPPPPPMPVQQTPAPTTLDDWLNQMTSGMDDLLKHVEQSLNKHDRTAQIAAARRLAKERCPLPINCRFTSRYLVHRTVVVLLALHMQMMYQLKSEGQLNERFEPAETTPAPETPLPVVKPAPPPPITFTAPAPPSAPRVSILAEVPQADEPNVILADDELQNTWHYTGCYAIHNGQLGFSFKNLPRTIYYHHIQGDQVGFKGYAAEPGTFQPLKCSPEFQERIAALIQLWETYDWLVEQERGTVSGQLPLEAADLLDNLRQSLNTVYDDFVSKYGSLRSNQYLFSYQEQPDLRLSALAGLENPDGSKAQIFFERTHAALEVPAKKIYATVSDENLAEAVALSKDRFGHVNPDAIAVWFGATEEEIIQALITTTGGGKCYLKPILPEGIGHRDMIGESLRDTDE